jgi:hypothetical protein
MAIHPYAVELESPLRLILDVRRLGICRSGP